MLTQRVNKALIQLFVQSVNEHHHPLVFAGTMEAVPELSPQCAAEGKEHVHLQLH